MYHAKESRQHVYSLHCDPGSQLCCVIATIAFGMVDVYVLCMHMFKVISVYCISGFTSIGFQPKKSTTAVLLDVYNNWAMEIDRVNEVCAISFEESF